MNFKCNCGRDIRYAHVKGKSCNKHYICPPYEEVEEKRDEYHRALLQVIKVAETLATHKESSFHYTDAEAALQMWKDKYLNIK